MSAVEVAESLLRLQEYAELCQKCIDAHIAAGRVVQIGKHYYLTNVADANAAKIQRAFKKAKTRPRHVLKRGSLVKMIATGRVYAVVDVKLAEFGVNSSHGVRYMDLDMANMGTEWIKAEPFRFKKGAHIVNKKKPQAVFMVAGHTIGSWHKLSAKHSLLHAKVNKRDWRLATFQERGADAARVRKYDEAFQRDLAVHRSLKAARRT
eukprot:g3358.t1